MRVTDVGLATATVDAAVLDTLASDARHARLTDRVWLERDPAEAVPLLQATLQSIRRAI